jgi:two-component system, chemotaxis family, CheB/CheR fusion protein
MPKTQLPSTKTAQHTEPSHRSEDPRMDFPIVGIGASAGGLDACKKLVSALPAETGMAFILIQHLDPTHESMMVDLLAGHTPMTVLQASNGMAIRREHLYVIPPGTYLSVANGTLHVSPPQVRHGARLPFDFLLHSLAADRGAAAICVVLSGSGADGSLGLKAIKLRHGLVIAQDPEEAGFDGMPRSAILTGAVDVVLPIEKMPDAIVKYGRRIGLKQTTNGARPAETTPDWLPEIIELLRARTTHDFTLYKQGTLRRRIERRMAMAAIESDDMYRYLDLLRGDPNELDMLAKDLLINVTSFFRDPKVFEVLAETIVPELIEGRPPDQAIRIWVAGCSTGEETYSLAMIFKEKIMAARSDVRLQVFASDIDVDAIARAREGVYPEAIEADVSPVRLARFFTKDEHGYKVVSELRALVIFTVHDVLADPPFSRIDLISCRNLLIYLRPDAQTRVISLFHFALREGGLLLLGSSETAGETDGGFEVIAKPERIYRHIGRSRSGEPGRAPDSGRITVTPGQDHAPSRQSVLAELCRRLVLDTHAPAAVLVNRKLECLFSLGPADRYLRVAPGGATHELLAMAHEDIRTKLRSAVQQAIKANARTVVTGGRTSHEGRPIAFSLDIQPVISEGEALLLICFVNETVREPAKGLPARTGEPPEVATLEQELEATRAELQGTIRALEISSDEQRAINEEALSVQEEFQSTNEELLTSKEELQSLNEELTALNSQLQETLEKQRTTANDLQNVLYSTDVATIFLDAHLKIRFFTPATRALFNVIPGDVGRPLEDLRSLAADDALLADARTVLRTLAPIEREIEAGTGSWYVRRVLPYRTQGNRIEGVVITFSDITSRARAADAMGVAQRQAEQANLAKSRFLAAASHDLRQPLQTLVLLQGSLTKVIEGDAARRLLTRLDQALSAMSGMLNALLDINQIEAGTVRAEMIDFPINDLFERMKDEFSYHAKAKGIDLRMVRCGVTIHSDIRLLEQMLRNLLSNAVKYTRHGKVLLGCRRREGMLSIEIWDTGVGIPDDEFQAIFEEYHQLNNAARERSHGLGLGLSIVQRLGKLMGHRVRVGSRLGKGSVFAIEIVRQPVEAEAIFEHRNRAAHDQPGVDATLAAEILVIEDDPGMADLLAVVLAEEGYRTSTAPDGVTALDLVTRGAVHPDLLLADFNLPNGMNGIQATAKVREALRRDIPVVILTGDISTNTLRNVALQNYVQLNKPVKPQELLRAIKGLLPVSRPVPRQPSVNPGSPIVYIVDDDGNLREGIRDLLEADGHTVEDYASCETFLDGWRPGHECCLIIDAYLPGMSGLDLLKRLMDAGQLPPAIMITGDGDVSIAVQAMKAGAADFIEKPVGREALAAAVARALDQGRDADKRTAWREDAASHIAGLTMRQHQIMDLVLTGHPSKNIAADLGISQRTVENHRAAIMKKTGSKSLPALARLAVAAEPLAKN